MKIELYERIWIWVATLMIAAFLGAMVFAASRHAVHAPSHVETIDPLRVKVDSEFAHPGVFPQEDGSVLVVAVAEMFRFLPETIRVPAGAPVRFRITSPDVIHGYQIVGTNANVMAIPGYVTDFTLSFPKPGEYLLLCNEYCGLSHHLMQGKLIVEGSAP
ncbi:MAG: cytochrome c oxidase subunit II [Acidobacteria bacterium]|nr:cytochrome c oxidase subunit II [Acidobacteriota bacterium]